jgi:hypothetical protein
MMLRMEPLGAISGRYSRMFSQPDRCDDAALQVVAREYPTGTKLAPFVFSRPQSEAAKDDCST